MSGFFMPFASGIGILASLNVPILDFILADGFLVMGGIIGILFGVFVYYFINEIDAESTQLAGGKNDIGGVEMNIQKMKGGKKQHDKTKQNRKTKAF